MTDILFLAHRIPYPPNKGDKIRSFNILRYLSARYRVHLGAFIDDDDDWQHVPAIEAMCASVKLVSLHKYRALLRSGLGFLSGEPLSMPYYRDAGMRRWVRELFRREQVAGLFVFSSTMAQYVPPDVCGPAVLDLCDVDSDKWRQYAQRHAFPRNWVYRREARLLAAAERNLAQRFDAVVVVSQTEADLLMRVAPASASKITVMRNGVDTEYFDPQRNYPSVFRPDELPIVFTGAMDYWANIDAVQWFAKEVLPQVLLRHPGGRFYIVGSRPDDAVRALAALPGVAVTGTVADVRPYLSGAHVVVAPLRIARGIQNKVLEALAMARPVVATPAALDGLDDRDYSGAVAAASAAEFAAAVACALDNTAQPMAGAGRRYVCGRYGWEASLGVLDGLLACK